MLAKIWKKVLLAICIIACIYNIMSKLVNRTSLELNLKSVENGESILSVFKDAEKDSETVDGVVNEKPGTISENVISETEGNELKQTNTTDFVVIY